MTISATTMAEPLTVADLRRWDVAWASLAGVGFVKPAPGTWGSAAAALLWWFVLAGLPWWQQGAVCLAYLLISLWTAQRICQRHGLKDAPQIVADEVAGMWIALLFLPQVWWLVLLAFGLFRLLDIVKPGPIGWLDKNLHGGWGVMLDDLLAGFVTAGVLYFTVPLFG